MSLSQLYQPPRTFFSQDNYHYLLSSCEYCKVFNDTHRERLMSHSIQYRSGWLTASDLFDMFTQSIHSSSIHSIISADVWKMWFMKHSKNGWLLLSASFMEKFGWVFVLTLEKKSWNYYTQLTHNTTWEITNKSHINYKAKINR